MPTELPDNLNRYFTAQNDHDVDAMSAAFATDAEVLDEGHTYVGREAIRGWKLATSVKHGIAVQPLSATSEGEIVSVVAKATGIPGQSGTRRTTSSWTRQDLSAPSRSLIEQGCGRRC